MKRSKYCLAIFFILLASVPAAYAQQVSSDKDIFKLIDEARKNLKDEKVDVMRAQVGVRKVKVGKRKYKTVPIIGVVGREMSVAIADAEDKIHIVRCIKRDRGLETVTPGYTLNLRRDNGFNSDIAVVSPANGMVLAVKYPLMNDHNRFGTGEAMRPIIYTPFSGEINTEKTMKEGVKVLDEFVDKAYDKLKEKDVRSRAFPGEKITKVIPKDVLKTLMLNEHIDPSEFKSAGLASSLVERVLVIIGTNKETAYAYTISPAGAFGLVQMIPSTYRLLLGKYPVAQLNPNFGLGMADPINAVMAQVLLCDSDWQAIREVRDVSAEKVGPYLAAAYNGGVGHVLTLLRRNNTDWMEDPDHNQKPTVTTVVRAPVRVRVKGGKYRTTYVTKYYSSPVFRSETSKYVQQYTWIRSFIEARDKKAAANAGN